METTRQLRSAARDLQLDHTRMASPRVVSPRITQVPRSAFFRSRNDSRSSPVMALLSQKTATILICRDCSVPRIRSRTGPSAGGAST